MICGQLGEPEKELADYTRLIDHLPGAPVDQVADAFLIRGLSNYERGDYRSFLEDTKAALDRNSARDFAAFNLALALLANNRDPEALEAYRRAAIEHPGGIERLGLADLNKATKIRDLLNSLRP